MVAIFEIFLLPHVRPYGKNMSKKKGSDSLRAGNIFELEGANNRNDIFILTEREPGTCHFKKIRAFQT